MKPSWLGIVRAVFGRLDVIINNAGVTGWTRLFEITEEEGGRVLDTNLKGTFFCPLEAARLMKETGGGSIINVSTMTGQVFFVNGGWTVQGRIPEENLERAAQRNALGAHQLTHYSFRMNWQRGQLE